MFLGLTASMDRYCRARFAGANPSEAYRQAYNCERSSAATVANNASDLEADPRIVSRVQQMVERRDTLSSLAPRVTKEFVLNGVVDLALNADKDSTRLRAFELLGKSVGIDLFRETHVTEKRDRTVEEVDAALREHLASLAPMIEGTARDTTQAKAVPTAKDRRRKPTA